MSMLLTLVLGFVTCRYGPQIVAEIVATLTAARLVLSSRRSRRRLLRYTAAGPADWDVRPTRAQRQALQSALHTSLDLAVFTSLLPQQASRGYKLAAVIADLTHAVVADRDHGVARRRRTDREPVHRG